MYKRLNFKDKVFKIEMSQAVLSQQYFVEGIVIATSKNQFTIQTENEDRYKCKCDFFKPVREGDIIHGAVLLNDKTLIFSEEPFAEIPTDENNVRNFFIRALYGFKFGKVSADTLYKQLDQMTEGKSNVVDFLSQEADSFHEGNREPILRMFKETTLLEDKQIPVLLKWWRKNYSLRRLYLLGLNDKEIEDSHTNLKQLYDICMDNPYKIPSIPMEKCATILRFINQQPSGLQISCGQIVRKIYEMSENRGWTSTPLWMLSKLNTQFHVLKPILEQEYNVHFDEGFAYLEYPYTVETTVCQYIDQKIKESKKHLEIPFEGKEMFTSPSLTEEQKIAIRGALNEEISIITGGAGTGKCLDPLTLVLMFDGMIKFAKDIHPGDLLMGDDSASRKVLNTTSGMDEMYEIIPEKGMSFKCNYPHVLTLIGIEPKIVDTTVCYSIFGERITKTFKTENEARLFWATLGNDIFDMPLNEYLNQSEQFKEDTFLFHQSIDFQHQRIHIHPYKFGYNLADKVIPTTYLINSREVRIKLLNGLIEAEGEKNGCTIEFKRCSTNHQIKFLAFSLGYMAYESNGRLIIDMTGNTRSRFIVHPIGKGPYCGFELSGNGRFLLEDCTVTHNTTIIGEIVNNLKRRNLPFFVGSFTGKAVARLQEILGHKTAKTLDRAIVRSDEIKPFTHLIIDESSMITTELFYRFITRFPGKYKITLVGDLNQLQPIGWGSLMKQLMETNRIPVFRLSVNHRIVRHIVSEEDIDAPEEKSSERIILQNAEALINPNRDFNLPVNLKDGVGFSVIEGQIDLLTQLIFSLKEAGVSPNDITVICPYVNYLPQLNEVFQQLFLNPQEVRVDSQGKKWFIGDRVMMRVNNYLYSVMNGDEGRVISFDEEGISVEFKGGNVLKYKYDIPSPSKDQDEEMEDVLTTSKLDHSFAISIHKSQGSEQKYIIIFIPNRVNSRGQDNSTSNFINVNLLYTAITRAKEAVWILGSIPTIVQATCRIQPKRIDLLAKRLQSLRDCQLEGSEVTEQFDEMEPQHEDLSMYENN